MDIKQLLRPNIRALKPYASARDEFKGVTDNMVFLDANENPFENGVNRYPDPYQLQLKTKLAKIKGVQVENILLGNGSDEVLDLIFRAFCEPNQDNIITLPPTYGMYGVLAELNAIAIKKINLDHNFQPQAEVILKEVDNNSKLLFICSPNNPSGNSFSSENIKKLIENFKGIVIVDEAYIDFSSEESWLRKLEQYPNLIVTQTLSKAFAMAGIRLGICYASAEIISILNNIKPPYNINELTQQKAIELLSDKDTVKNQVTAILRERDILISELKTIDFISKIYPTDANFVLVKVDDANKRYNQLIDKGIVTRNRTTQPNCENTLRLTVGTATENKILIKTLTEL
ncbi:MAG: histidinol-phosphate transaminase [Aestuariibaculum sp.]